MGGTIRVVLTAEEMMEAAYVGCARHVQNTKRGLIDKARNPWQVHIEGACGEKAVAKHLGITWTGNLGDYKAADVGHFQVRTTGPGKDMILHNKNHGTFIAVNGSNGEYVLSGWIDAEDGKRTEYWSQGDGRPCYFVPLSALHSMNTLKQEQASA